MTTALVTGAASGLGLEIARALLMRGVEVILVDRDPAVASLASELLCECIVCDLSTDEGTDEVLKRLDGSVGIVVSNAGAAQKGAMRDQEPNALRDMIGLNVTAPALIARRFIESTPSRPACLVIVSSSMAVAPTPMLGTYGASKSFQTSLAEALDVESLLGATNGVRVLCAEPSGMATGFQQAAGVNHAESRILLAPEDVAALIADEILSPRGRSFLRIGTTGKMLAIGKRVLPRAVFARLTGRMLARFR